MVIRKSEGALTKDEKRIVKALISSGERNQDVQALINIGRTATINSARITEVKHDKKIIAASDADVEFFKTRKRSYDYQTGLNLYDDERLIRAREAMILAVQVFNSPALKFKTEVFSVLANIAWTYLLHQYYEAKGEKIVQDDGRSLLLSQMLERHDCPLSQGMRDNLKSLKTIRDTVEHLLFRRSDLKFLSVFQACCLNFDSKLCELFGDEKTLKNDLSFSLQFAKIGFDQVTQLQSFDVPQEIEAIDKAMEAELGDARLGDLEYRFRVVYTLENSTKSKSHIKFVHPGDDGADEVRHVLIKQELSDKNWPHKPATATRLIQDASGKKFTSHNHNQAWRMFDIRPRGGVQQPQNTDKEFCVYHEAHKDYTYSQKWVEFVSKFIANDENYEQLKKFRLT